jgi:hypothetical protein
VLKLIKDEMVLKGQELEYKTKTAVGVGRFLTQKILRPDKIEKLIQHPCQGAIFITLKSNEVSNSILTDGRTRRTDAFFCFMIVGRAECLLTPANMKRWFQNGQGEGCRRCQEKKKPTFPHILNE